MQAQEKKVDDHHCAVHERDRLKSELADCDTKAKTPDEQEDCHTEAKEKSHKREWQCKYS